MIARGVSRRTAAWVTLGMGISSLLASCVGGSRGTVATLVDGNSQFQQAGSIGTKSSGKPWWETFHDRVLNRLIRQALGNNLDLRAAGARIAQADATLQQAGGRLFPQVDANGSYGLRWTDDAANKRTTSTDLGALLDWEIDLWGRLRSAREARRLERDAAVSDWLGARLLLSASVAETYVEILEQKVQLRLLEEQIEAGQTLLELTELRFGQAQSSVVDVLQQREQLAATKTRVPDVEGRLQQLTYALDVLLGVTPGNGHTLSSDGLIEAPRVPHVGVPSELLLKRPDLVASRQRVAAIDHEIAEAIADCLPRVTLGGSASGFGRPGLDSAVATAVASIAAPVFDAGIRKSEVARREAALKEALASYSQDYLAAIRDVETALVLKQKQAERVGLLEKQLQTAQRLFVEARSRFSQGLTDYLPVLTAIETVQTLEREMITSRRELLSFHIALHRAIGGPMDLTPTAD